MVAYEFLRAFNAKLDPATGTLSETKGKAVSKKSSAAAVKGAALGRLRGLHGMTVFGLVYSHISKKAVELLRVSASACAILSAFCVSAHILYTRRQRCCTSPPP